MLALYQSSPGNQTEWNKNINKPVWLPLEALLVTAGFSSVWSPMPSFFVLLSTENFICKKKNDQRQLKGTENLLEG